ncbi:putative acetyltransferase [Enterobacter cloacae]|uniref:Putative acetyltransferase n=1 Tax=Enterobacter cloacae TaxID=550 RepID=A0A377LRP2_ENTCL|nr:putative acetyltransferase [Enterobacter cloacae]
MIRKWQSENTASLLSYGLKVPRKRIRLLRRATGKRTKPWCGTFICRRRNLGLGTGWRTYGFISVMQSQFVGALFVAPAYIGKGIGRALLNHVQQRFPHLSLEVYQKNVRAVNFYHAQGFRIEDSAWQDDTQHPTWIMSWQADQTPSE